MQQMRQEDYNKSIQQKKIVQSFRLLIHRYAQF